MGSQFIASRCAHIDTVGSNVLIRGNMPLVGSRYAYDEIASASGVDLTGRHLIEMPIIDNVGERWEFSAILRAFEADPGQYPESFWPWWLQSDYDPNWLQGTRVTSGGRSHPGSFVWRPFEGLPEPPGTPRSCRGRCRPCEPPGTPRTPSPRLPGLPRTRPRSRSGRTPRGEADPRSGPGTCARCRPR